MLSATRRPLDGSSYDILIKTILIGDSGVGKSSLLYRYTDQDWNPHYIATIGVDFKVLTFERCNKVVKLQLWDTAGQERFRTITHAYYRGSHGIMLVFDLTNQESFENIRNWLQDVRRYAAEGLPMILIGNKADVFKHRQVSYEDAMGLATELGCRYFETSAKDDKGVEEAFDEMISGCIAQRAKVGLDGVRSNGSRGTRLPPVGETLLRGGSDSGRCQC